MMQQHFELIAMPQSPAQALSLSQAMTQQFGAQGWRLVSVVAVGGGALLLAFERPF